MTTLSTFFDMVFVNASESSGHGPFTLGSALIGFQTAASAGITNGTPVSYRAFDGVNWETAHGVVDVSGSVYTLTRGVDTIKSSNSNSLVSFGSGVTVLIFPLSQDLNALVSTGAAQSFSMAQKATGRSNLAASPQNGFFLVGLGASNVSIPQNSTTQVPLSNVVEDDQSYFNASAYTYTPTVAGIYQICFSAFVVVGTPVGGNYGNIAYIRKNGTPVAAGGYLLFASTGASQVVSSVVYPVSLNGSTDYVDFAVYTQCSGASVYSNSYVTFAWGYQIK